MLHKERNIIKYKLKNESQNLFNPIETIAQNRGLNKDELEFHLNPTEFHHDRSKLINMQRGVKVFLQHIEEGKNISTLLDGDADGFLAGCTLLSWIKKTFPDYYDKHVSYHLHDKKKHGIEEHLIPDDTDLYIITDASSSEYEEHKKLKDKGIEVLVIDHHETEMESPYATVINNQLSPEYPNKGLSGCAMVYLFLKEVDKALGINHADEFKDLVAWSIITDSIELTDKETRWLLHDGLNNVKNDLLKAFIDRNAKGMELTPHTLSYKINPQLNAAIRIGDKELLESIVKALLNHKEITYNSRLRRPNKNEDWAEKTARECSNAYVRQGKMRDEVLEHLIPQAEEQKDNAFLVLTLPNDTNMNLTGLVASKLVNQYSKPVLVLKDKDGEHVGSMRGYDPFMSYTKDFLNTIDRVEATGHQGASGVSIEGDIEEAILNINGALGEHVDSPVVVDLSLPVSFMTESFIYSMEKYKSLWGRGIEEPRYLVKGVEVNIANIELIGKNKDMVKFKDSNGVTYLMFNNTEEVVNLTSETNKSKLTLNVIGKTSVNVYRDTKTPQFVIDDMEIVEVTETKNDWGGWF